MAHGDEVTPDRSVPSWAMPATSENAEEALKALQVYKKKDAEKGEHFLPLLWSVSRIF